MVTQRQISPDAHRLDQDEFEQGRSDRHSPLAPVARFSLVMGFIVLGLLGTFSLGTLFVTASMTANAQPLNSTAQQTVGIFFPYQTIAPEGETAAQAVGIGDFNHDGRLDVAMTSGVFSSNYLYVFHQKVDGRLDTPARYAADVQPEGLAVGDFNGDDRDDVAVYSVSENRVAVYFQTNNGTLDNPLFWTTQVSPSAITGADVNSDGLRDLVIAHEGHPSVGVLLQQPKSVFQGNNQQALAPMILYPAPEAGNDDIDTGDVNDDGRVDVVKMNGKFYANPNLSVLHQTTQNRLATPIAYDLEGKYLSDGMAVGDVTGDGHADVVITHIGDMAEPSKPKLSVFAHGLWGELYLAETYDTSAKPEPVEIIDMDHDGRNDVVTAGQGELLLFLQNTLGKLDPYQSYPIPVTSRIKSQGLDLGDINSDGHPDVVLASYDVGLVILYQNAPPLPPTPTATPTFVPTALPSGTPTPTFVPTQLPTGHQNQVYLPFVAGTE